MPLIPTYTSKENLTTQVPAINKSAELEAQAGIGGVLTDVGKLIGEVNAKFEELRDVNQLSDAKLLVAQRQAELEDKVNKDPDVWNATKTLDNDLTKIGDEAAAKLSSPTARDKFRKEYEVHRIAYTQGIKDAVRKKQIAVSKVNTYRDLELQKSNYINASSEEEKKLSAENMQAIVDTQVRLGVFDADDGYKLVQSTIKDAEEGIKDEKAMQEKRNKEIRLAQEYAQDQKEDEMIKARLDKKLTIDEVKKAIKSEEIKPKVGQALINSLKSPKTVGAKTKSRTFTEIADSMVFTDEKPENIKEALLKANTLGSLSDEDFSILFTFSQVINNEKMKDMYPNQSFFKGIKFWGDENVGAREESKMRMYKSYMNRIKAGEEPALAVDAVVKEETLLLHPQAKTYPKEGTTIMDANGITKLITPDGVLKNTEGKE